MAVYFYKAYNKNGMYKEGEIEAIDRQVAFSNLGKMNLHPIEILALSESTDTRWWNKELFESGQISQNNLFYFSRNMSVLLSANLPLDEVLRLVKDSVLNKRLLKVYDDVLNEVLSGASLSKSLRANKGYFPDYYISMIEAGELSGSLNQVFSELSSYLEQSIKIKEQIKSSLIYPAILVLMAIFTLVIIFTVLIPNIVPIFEGNLSNAPSLIVFAIWFEKFLEQYWLGLLVLIFAVGAIGALILQSEAFKTKFDNLVLKAPFIGELISGSETARIVRLLSVLLMNGVPLISSLKIIEPICKNKSFSKLLADGITSVQEGKKLHQAFEGNKIFPSLATRLISLGESSGNLNEILLHVANIFETRVQQKIQFFITLLTPIITLSIGLGIGLLIFSVMDAILSVNDLAFQ